MCVIVDAGSRTTVSLLAYYAQTNTRHGEISRRLALLLHRLRSRITCTLCKNTSGAASRVKKNTRRVKKDLFTGLSVSLPRGREKAF